MFCSNCGAPLAPGAAFCQECGTAVPQRAQAAAPVQPAPQQPAAAAPVQRASKRSRRKTCLVIAGALFGLLVVCSIVGSLTDSEPEEKAAATTPAPAVTSSPSPDVTPATTSEPIAAAEPTSTNIVDRFTPTVVPESTAPVVAEPAADAPTVTLVIPTVAPIPTVLPTVPVAAVAPDVAAYFAEANVPMQQYGEWLGRLGEQSTKAGKTPSLFFDDDWKIETVTALVALRSAGQSLGALSPVPEQVKPFDDLLKKISAETEPLTDEYARGVDNVDAALLTSASTRLGRIAGWINELSAERERIVP